MRRLSPIATIIMFLCLLLPSVAAQDATPTGTPVQEASPEASPVAGPPTVTIPTGVDVDLAAMVLVPNEIDPAFTSGGSSLLDADGAAGLYAENLGTTPDVLGDQLANTGFIAQYDRYGGVLSEADPAVYARSGSSYAVLYADSDGAEAGFALIEDESNAPVAGEDVATAPQLGDQSELTRFDGIDPFSGEPFTGLDYTFRIGNLVAGVGIYQYDGSEPDEAVITALAEQQLARVQGVLAAGGPGLFQTALRIDGTDAWSLVGLYEEYGLLDGTTSQATGEPDDYYAARVAYWSVMGVGSMYRVDAYFLPPGQADPSAALSVMSSVFRFGSDEEAAAFADGMAAWFVDNTSEGYLAVEELDAMPTVDGAASGVFYEFQISDDATGTGYRYWVQHGSDVISVGADSADGITEAGLTNLVEAQAACLDVPEASCEPISLPQELLS